MARSVSFGAYKKFVRDVEAKILRTTTAYVNKVKAKIEQEVAIINASFFSTLVRSGIDVAGPPGLQEFTPNWKPLKRNYAKWKEKKYPGSGFFKASGKLRTSLRQAKGGLLGKPKVTLVKLPRAVKRGEAFRMVVEPAPAMRNKRGIQLLEQINSGTFQRSMKLSAFKGRITRPLVEPYLNWWVKYVITPSVVRRLK